MLSNQLKHINNIHYNYYLLCESTANKVHSYSLNISLYNQFYYILLHYILKCYYRVYYHNTEYSTSFTNKK
jgi:hypothetical protein